MRTYRCTECKTEFEFDSTRSTLFCPLCGATARYTKDAGSTTASSTTSTGTGKSTKLTETKTKITQGTATVPSGWTHTTTITQTNQSQSHPYAVLTQLNASKTNGQMWIKNGEDYLYVKAGFADDQTHKDGSMDKYFQTPMLKFTSFEDYLDKLAVAFLPNVKLTTVNTVTLPSYYGQNADVYKKAVTANANSLAKAFKNSELTFKLVSQSAASTLRQYKFTNNKTACYLLLGADMSAYEFTLTGTVSGGTDTAGSLLGVLGSLISTNTAASTTKTKTGDFITWGSDNIFGLITDEANFNANVTDYQTLVSTYKQDGSLDKNLAALTTTTTTNTTTSASSGSSSTDLTGMLGSLLGSLLSGK